MRKFVSRIPLVPKILLLTIAGMIIGAILTTCLVNVPTPYTPGQQSDWISFFGNISGGILGGIVAYVVARMQISEQKREEKIRDLLNQLPPLVSIGFEIDEIIKGFTDAQRIITSLKESQLRQQIEQDISNFDPRLSNVRITSLRDEYWCDIWKIGDVDLVVELLKLKEFYKEFQYTIGFNLNMPIPMPVDQEMFLTIQLMEANKKAVWDKFTSQTYLERSVEIKEKINKLLNHIYKVKQTREIQVDVSK